MKTIAFYNQKGGTGKTVLTLLLSRYLAAAGKRVLTIDLDPQGSLTDHFFRLDGSDPKGRSSADIFEGEPIGDLVTPTAGPALVGSSRSLQQYTVSALVKQLKNSLSGYSCDYTVIDCAPAWSAITQAGLYAADVVVIPALPSIDDLEQASWTYETAGSVCDGSIWVLFNQFSKERSGAREKEITDHYGEKFKKDLLPFSVPASTLVRQYTDQSEPVTGARGKVALFEPIQKLAEKLGCKKVPERF